MALWREVFPSLTWAEVEALPADKVHQMVTYLKIKAEVEKAKQEIRQKNG